MNCATLIDSSKFSHFWVSSASHTPWAFKGNAYVAHLIAIYCLKLEVFVL